MLIVPWKRELVYSSAFRNALEARRSAIVADALRARRAILERHDSAEAAREEIHALNEYTRGRLEVAHELVARKFPPLWIEPGQLPG
jgi:hypothetical protein